MNVCRFLIFFLLFGCTAESSTTNDSEGDKTLGGKAAVDMAVATFCSDCHQRPDPAYFTKDDWPREVYRGFRFHIDAGRGPVASPSVEEAVRYFTSRAPEKLAESVPIQFTAEAKIHFTKSTVVVPQIQGAAISFLSWHQTNAGSPIQICFSDMLSGSVRAWSPGASGFVSLSGTSHPAGLEWCDLDSDSLMDLVVSDLGSFQPEDNDRGRILWLRQRIDGGFDEVMLAEGLGRVSESRAADFDGDGLLDLVVAEFGWLKTGHILLFRQRIQEDGSRVFEKRVIDERHGAIRVPPVDLNGDGAIDFVANITQEHEAIEAFLNSGEGSFENVPLCSPRDPAFGSCGLLPADLDNDGDIDFLVSNGDMFDSFAIKPYHGLRWLENRGSLSFVDHELLRMPGLHGIATGDVDGDGDLDIALSAFFPYRLFLELQESGKDVVSAIWMEQTSPGKFQPHLVEQNAPWHACVILADVDVDDDLDMVLGDFSPEESALRSPFVIYENDSKKISSEK